MFDNFAIAHTGNVNFGPGCVLARWLHPEQRTLHRSFPCDAMYDEIVLCNRLFNDVFEIRKGLMQRDKNLLDAFARPRKARRRGMFDEIGRKEFIGFVHIAGIQHLFDKAARELAVFVGRHWALLYPCQSFEFAFQHHSGNSCPDIFAAACSVSINVASSTSLRTAFICPLRYALRKRICQGSMPSVSAILFICTSMANDAGVT